MATSISNQVNNDIYDQLGERWYHAKDDPIALLRAEARAQSLGDSGNSISLFTGQGFGHRLWGWFVIE
jgi:hypothetical protein